MIVGTFIPRSGKGGRRGAIVVEFVIVLPLLCLLLFAMLFLHHIQDYDMDAGIRIRAITADKMIPFRLANASANSDISGAGAATQAAPASAGGFSLLAAERYYGTTPCERMGMPLKNYVQEYAPDKPMTKNPWGRLLLGFGGYYGSDKVWTGTEGLPEGHDAIWRERFPVIVDPWQRNFARFEDLAIMNSPTASLAGLTLRLCTTPLARVEMVKVDAIEDGETRHNEVRELEGGVAAVVR